jgi:hypothetical protein
LKSFVKCRQTVAVGCAAPATTQAACWLAKRGSLAGTYAMRYSYDTMGLVTDQALYSYADCAALGLLTPAGAREFPAIVPV